MPARQWIDLARRAAPHLDLRPLEVIETGWDSRVLRAFAEGDRVWIFRFPRRPDVLPDLAREGTLLSFLRGALPVAIPDWQVYTFVDAQLVIGYPELHGLPAGEEPHGDGDFRFRIPLPPPAAYADTLGRTLAALHRSRPPGLPWVSAAELRQQVADVLHGAEHLDLPSGPITFWRNWLADDASWTFRPVMTHGDVHPGHTMIDEAGALVGLIDWTDSGWGDPASDFVDLRHAYGPAFGTEVLTAYRRSGGAADGLEKRVLQRQSFGVLHAIRFGLEHHRPELTRRAVQRMAQQAARIGAGQPPV